jgi:hypothetical protein
LPAAGSLRFALLREWLQWCDKSHEICNRHDKKKLPTRLLYVGDLDDPDYNPDILKLVPGEQIDGEKYAALSHCWGNLTSDPKEDFWTTKENKDERGKEFPIAKLPRTFRDAIKVTRGVGVKYLWIDLLCIIQGKEGDWKEESKRMEDVYTSVRSTIAER